MGILDFFSPKQRDIVEALINMTDEDFEKIRTARQNKTRETEPVEPAATPNPASSVPENHQTAEETTPPAETVAEVAAAPEPVTPTPPVPPVESVSEEAVAEPAPVNPNSNTECQPYNEKIELLEKKIQELLEANKTLTAEIKGGIDKDLLVRELHKELQEYKNDLYSKILSPFLKELISWADKIRSTASYYIKNPNAENTDVLYGKLQKEYSKLSLQVDDILYNFDIEPYTSKEGEAFNAKIHKTVKLQPTTDEAKDKTIAESINVGYKDNNGRIIRHEEVIIYKLN